MHVRKGTSVLFTPYSSSHQGTGWTKTLQVDNLRDRASKNKCRKELKGSQLLLRYLRKDSGLGMMMTLFAWARFPVEGRAITYKLSKNISVPNVLVFVKWEEGFTY